jgi:uroporphyrinogen-III decarboxylase
MLKKCGIDSAVMYDDWGLQNSLYINPKSWREIWREPYRRVIECLHSHGMKFMLHSCGFVHDIIDDFVEIGVDAFQFDQPALYDFNDLSAKIGGKATLWSPVDIQKVLPTGDKEKIQVEAKRMIQTFYKGGGLIAMDYGSLADIGVKDEWAQYARDVFTESK